METLSTISAWLGALLLSVILSVVLALLLQNRIHWILVRLLGGFIPRGPRSVKGIWIARYTCDSDPDFEKEVRDECQIIELRQLGIHVWGRNLTGIDHWYKMRGRLDRGIYLTGLWDNISEGDIYHGAFQLVIHPTGKSMTGKWLGFNNRHEINHGPWGWKLITPHINRKTKAQIIRTQGQFESHTTVP